MPSLTAPWVCEGRRSWKRSQSWNGIDCPLLEDDGNDDDRCAVGTKSTMETESERAGNPQRHRQKEKGPKKENGGFSDSVKVESETNVYLRRQENQVHILLLRNTSRRRFGPASNTPVDRNRVTRATYCLVCMSCVCVAPLPLLLLAVQQHDRRGLESALQSQQTSSLNKSTTAVGCASANQYLIIKASN